ncbi:hypothetical protein BC936DRAFT_138027 [Jimgerdemannia flammicorona]|uniref:DUF7789 domain-containing protein n=1 Tax=Jimgerdemannia flammicorona TaxID=994334 RepID=A0A433CW27_9FUNG|nr:hypothetical protein BC936DRAFT_138027 [Jimgerdemannia flammicorona]
MTIYSGIQYRQAATLFDNAAAKVLYLHIPRPPQHFIWAESHTATIIAIIEAKLGMFHQSYWAELMVVATMVVFMLIFTAFAYKLYQEFGWSIYKKIGADLAMRDVYKMYQIFMMLLKFDVFFFLSLSIQYLVVLVVRGNTAGANFNLSSLLIKHILLSTIVTVVMMVLAFWGLKSERRTVLYSFMVCGVCSMAYFIYLLVDVNNNPDFYEGSRTFLTFFLAVCIALIVITLVISVFCTRNFGKGLKYHITHANGSTSTSLHRLRPLPGGEKPETTTNSDNGRRWSIE